MALELEDFPLICSDKVDSTPESPIQKRPSSAAKLPEEPQEMAILSGRGLVVAGMWLANMIKIWHNKLRNMRINAVFTEKNWIWKLPPVINYSFVGPIHRKVKMKHCLLDCEMNVL